MTNKTTAIDLFNFNELGRATIGGTEYVVYWDGAYQHAVLAGELDREFDDDKYTDDGDGYTEWCQDLIVVPNDSAIAVGRAIGLTHVHSTDGTLERLVVSAK